MSKQPEALRLAERFEYLANLFSEFGDDTGAIDNRSAAAELRRLHEVNQELVEALEDMHKAMVDYEMDVVGCEVPNRHRDLMQRTKAAIAKERGEG